MIIDEEFEKLKEKVERLEKIVLKKQKEFERFTTTDIDVSKITYLKSLKTVLDKCLALLNHVFENNPQNLGLTPDEIQDTFRENFGLPIPLPSISARLSSASGNYVSRTKIKGKPIKYKYQILTKGQEYIKEKIQEITKLKQ